MRATIKSLPSDAVYTVMDSPVGELLLIASDRGLHALLWKEGREGEWLRKLKNDPEHPVLKNAVLQLSEYFAGQRRQFDLPLAPAGTEFQLKAWNALREIPYGQTSTYGEQAVRVGGPNKARAVGMANGRNPISIIVPCHRVIGKNGELTGFGGGLPVKKFLLDLEKTH